MYDIRLLDLETTVNATTEVSTTDKEKADLLLLKLLQQFKLHVKARVQKAAKQSRWILMFAFKNLLIIAAMMILSNP